MEIRRLFVIAGTYSQFAEWCEEHDISRYNSHCHYANDESRLRGFSGGIFIEVGTAREREDTNRIVRALLCRSVSEATDADLDEWLALNRRQPLA